MHKNNKSRKWGEREKFTITKNSGGLLKLINSGAGVKKSIRHLHPSEGGTRIGSMSMAASDEESGSSGNCWILIFVGALTVLVAIDVALTLATPIAVALLSDGTTEASLEGAAEGFTDAALFVFLPAPRPSDADAEPDECLDKPDNPLDFSGPFFLSEVAYSEFLSPTHDRANHRPPAMPRISRLATRQCLTFFPLLSRGVGGAKLAGTLGGA